MEWFEHELIRSFLFCFFLHKNVHLLQSLIFFSKDMVEPGEEHSTFQSRFREFFLTLRCRSWALAEALGDHILWPNVPVAYGEGWVWKLLPKHHKVGSTCGGANPRPNMPTHLTSGLHKADLQ